MSLIQASTETFLSIDYSFILLSTHLLRVVFLYLLLILIFCVETHILRQRQRITRTTHTPLHPIPLDACSTTSASLDTSTSIICPSFCSLQTTREQQMEQDLPYTGLVTEKPIKLTRFLTFRGRYLLYTSRGWSLGSVVWFGSSSRTRWFWSLCSCWFTCMTFVRVTLIAVCWFRAFCTSRLWSFGARWLWSLGSVLWFGSSSGTGWFWSLCSCWFTCMTFVRVTLIAVCWFRAFCTSRLWSLGWFRSVVW